MSFIKRWVNRSDRTDQKEIDKLTTGYATNEAQFDAFEFLVTHNNADFVRIVAPETYFTQAEKAGYRALQIPLTVIQEIVAEKNKRKVAQNDKADEVSQTNDKKEI